MAIIKLKQLTEAQKANTGAAMVSQCGSRILIEYLNGTTEEGTIDSDINSWDIEHLIKIIQVENFTKAIK